MDCPSCGGTCPDTANFCPECGFQLSVARDAAARPAAPGAVAGEREIVGERRYVTVLFADLSGFTAYSEDVDPEEVRALANQAAHRLGEIVERYNGMVDKIIGDCVMAVFGAPVAHEDDEERAVRAAIDMLAYVEEHADLFARLALSQGLNTGEVMFAPVGPGGQWTVFGDVVNTAARLQGAAPAGQIFVGAATRAATRDVIEYQELEPITAKNKAEPVPVSRALHVKGDAVRRTASRARLVGRDAEIGRMWELWERARTDRRPYLATVVGDAGMGKTRQVSELAGRLQGTAAVATGRCLPYGEGITYAPVLQVVKDAAGIQRGDDEPTIARKLDEFLLGLHSGELDELRTIAAAVSHLVGVRTTPRGTYVTERISKGELHWGLRRVVELVAIQRPVLLVIEDVHWAEPTLVELLEFMLEGEGAPYLLVTTARPEALEEHPGMFAAKPDRRHITLSALDEAESLALTADLLGLDAVPGGPLGDLLRTADGNPMFVEEIVKSLADADLLDDEGRLRADVAPESVEVPSSLQGLVAARLDRLPPAERLAAQLAAVVGPVFWSGAVAHLAKSDPDPLLANLERLDVVTRRPASVVAGEMEWEFRHMLFREVAYQRLPKERRAEHHARCGEWIGGLSGAADERVEIRAHHLEQACLLARDVGRAAAAAAPFLAAASALGDAGDRAWQRESTQEAQRYYERGLTLADGRLPESAAELRLGLARVLMLAGRLHDAADIYSSVEGAVSELQRLDLRVRALAGHSSLLLALGRVTDAADAADAAIAQAQEVGNAGLAATAAFARAMVLAATGDVDTALDELARGVAAAEAKGQRRGMVTGLLRRGAWLVNAARLAEADEALSRAVELTETDGSVVNQAAATFALATVRYYRGPRAEARRMAEQAVAWFERTTDMMSHVQSLALLARLDLGDGDPAAARTRLEAALALAEGSGMWVVVDVHRYLAEALAREGDIEAGLKQALLADGAAEADDDYAQASAAMARGAVAAAEGDAEVVAARFGAAVAALEKLGLVTDVADARLAHGRALAAVGDAAGAGTELAAARAGFASIGADASVDQVKLLESSAAATDS